MAELHGDVGCSVHLLRELQSESAVQRRVDHSVGYVSPRIRVTRTTVQRHVQNHAVFPPPHAQAGRLSR